MISSAISAAGGPMSTRIAGSSAAGSSRSANWLSSMLERMKWPWCAASRAAIVSFDPARKTNIRPEPPRLIRSRYERLRARARDNSVFSSVKAILNPIGDLGEPGPAVGVRKRMSCGHLLDVPLRVQCIAFLERPPESAGKNGGDRGFTAARPTHGNQDAWFQLGDLKAPSALSARVVIGLEQWHKRYRTAFAR